MHLADIFVAQQNYFRSGNTRDYDFRIASLKSLEAAIRKREDDILAALATDFSKPVFESYISELDLVYQEISHVCRHLKRWMSPRRVRTPLLHFRARSHIHREPVGVVLIISPWNYPFQLAVSPLVSALAAGNCVMLKPSEISTYTSELLARIIAQCFAPEHVQVINGGVAVAEELLDLSFDHILFTGSTATGRIVMRRAAAHLTPVSLELGGKSPCIVDTGVPLRDTARRIVWGKFFNAGQSCIAPDYLLVHQEIKDKLLAVMKETITAFYGPDGQRCKSLARIINRHHCERLVSCLQSGEVIHGGTYDLATNYISPTLLENCALDSKIMTEEIFGPILPIFTFVDDDQLLEIIDHNKNPLALYIYSLSKQRIAYITRNIAFGSGCINDSLIQYGIMGLPFGGKRQSGFGKCHGGHGFETFSHQKSITHRAFGFDLKIRFPPYSNNLRFIKKLLHLGRISV